MTIIEAIEVFTDRGHTVVDSSAAPGRKWFIHFKNTVASPHAVFVRDLLREAQELLNSEIKSKGIDPLNHVEPLDKWVE